MIFQHLAVKEEIDLNQIVTTGVKRPVPTRFVPRPFQGDMNIHEAIRRDLDTFGGTG